MRRFGARAGQTASFVPDAITAAADGSKRSISRILTAKRNSGKSTPNTARRLSGDRKIPKEERDNMILVALGSEIVWIPKLKRIGERFKVTEDTKKILRMELKNG